MALPLRNTYLLNTVSSICYISRFDSMDIFEAPAPGSDFWSACASLKTRPRTNTKDARVMNHEAFFATMQTLHSLVLQNNRLASQTETAKHLELLTCFKS